ncbi:plasmid stabilization system protein ParE [Marinomonas sp. MED121]|uniref:type II toxin-antitoxin system RelE/ParE family toxin n=1 Tax=Marinomonas sp. MED121 TaxID=314277 RepID=UPI0000690B58|nr:type II toxin-antitoxin system RelE/ParE family toxin [Marinomonas sp. MED121]EAQ66070.1 plasmid stabilization system protein ParE [Marinomonas sp. MED121]
MSKSKYKPSAFKLSSMAQDHLRKIKNYRVSNFSEQQWNNYRDKLLIAFQMLADNPAVGSGCDELHQNAFYFPIGKHTAYFTKEDDFILIVAILSQSQLPQNHLK